MLTRVEHTKHPRKQYQHSHRDVKHQDRHSAAGSDIPGVPKPEQSLATKRKQSTGHQPPLPSTAKDSTLANNEPQTYYPAYCHKSSPTWFEWVKLTACEIHTNLHIKDGYQHSWLTEYRYARDAPQLLFYLNHPIQFVQVVGVVVGFDEYFDRFWLFTIDDSSGSTIDVVCRKPAKEKANIYKSDVATVDNKIETADEEEKEILQLSNLVANTVEIGSVLQVKGVITLFRRNRTTTGFTDLRNGTSPRQTPDEVPIRQIALQRFVKVHDTNQEINLIAARTQFYNSILSRPWILSQKEQQKLHKEALGEVENDKKRAKRSVLKRQRLVEIEKDDAELIRTEYAREEEEWEQAAEMVRRAGQQLKARLERGRGENAEKSAPKPDRTVSIEESGIESGKDYIKKSSHKRRKDDKTSSRPSLVIEQRNTMNESFAPLDDEKSALLRLAFG